MLYKNYLNHSNGLHTRFLQRIQCLCVSLNKYLRRATSLANHKIIQYSEDLADSLIKQHPTVSSQTRPSNKASRGELMLKNQNQSESVTLKKNDISIFLTGLALVFVFLLAAVSIRPVSAEETPFDFFHPPGELVPVGTHRLHIFCKGSGSPTVLIDSGMGSFSMEWKYIQDNLSKTSKTCIYDRAGYGWSEPGPSPRTTQQISNELYRLIQVKNLQGPFVLVGHSFGGYNMRYFANNNPEMVSGIVLVDSSHPDQFDRMDLKPVNQNKSRDSKQFKYTLSIPVMHEKYPTEVKFLAFRMLTQKQSHMARFDEQDHFRESAEQVAKANQLPNVPLVVITRGKRVWPKGERGDKLEAAWEAMQTELSYLSTISMQIVAKNSGHSIHLDQPELVASAVMNTINAARKIESNQMAAVSGNLEFVPAEHKTPLKQQYFDFPMIGAYVNHVTNTLYHDSSSFALNLHL